MDSPETTDYAWGEIAILMTRQANAFRIFPPVAKKCVELGFKVVLLYADIGPKITPTEEEMAIEGVKIVKLPIRGGSRFFPYGHPFWNFKEYFKLKRFMPKKPYGTLLTHIDTTGVPKVMIYWCKKNNIPTVVFQEGMVPFSDDWEPVVIDKTKNRRPLTRFLNYLIFKIPNDLIRIRPLYKYADYFARTVNTSRGS